jgi:hypothetical protein
VALGAPFFSGAGCAVTEGVAVASGVSVGVGAAVSSGVVVADGDALGVGDFFLRFDFVSGEELADGAGEIFFFGEAVGDGLGVDFPVERFRCFRGGVGVGVASKIFWIFVPNDSSAASGVLIGPTKIATMRKSRSIALIGEIRISRQVPEGQLCLTEFRLQSFREENSR